MLAAQSVQLVVSSSDPPGCPLLFTWSQGESRQLVLILPVSWGAWWRSSAFSLHTQVFLGFHSLGCALDLQCREWRKKGGHTQVLRVASFLPGSPAVALIGNEAQALSSGRCIQNSEALA